MQMEPLFDDDEDDDSDRQGGHFYGRDRDDSYGRRGLAGEAAHRAIPAATVVPVRVTAVTVQDAVQAARMVLTA